MGASSVPLLWSRCQVAPVSVSARGLQYQRRVVSVGPLSHGAVVIANPIVSQKGENEGSVRRTDSSLSIRDNLLVRGDTALLQHGSKLVGRPDGLALVVGDEVEPFQVCRSWNVAGPLVPAVGGAHPFVG